MALYDFECNTCEITFESLYRPNDPQDTVVCPKCGDAEHVIRQISAPGGYKMDSGPSSVRPRYAGSFKKKAK